MMRHECSIFIWSVMSGWEVSAWLSGVLVWDRLTREGMVLADVTTLSHPYVVVGEAPHSWVEPP